MLYADLLLVCCITAQRFNVEIQCNWSFNAKFSNKYGARTEHQVVDDESEFSSIQTNNENK